MKGSNLLRRILAVFYLLGGWSTTAILVPMARAADTNICVMVPEWLRMSGNPSIKAVEDAATRKNWHLISLANNSDIARIQQQFVDCFFAYKPDAVIVFDQFGIDGVAPAISHSHFPVTLIMFDYRYPSSGEKTLESIDNNIINSSRETTIVISQSISSNSNVTTTNKMNLPDILKLFAPNQEPGTDQCTTNCSYNKTKNCCEQKADSCQC